MAQIFLGRFIQTSPIFALRLRIVPSRLRRKLHGRQLGSRLHDKGQGRRIDREGWARPLDRNRARQRGLRSFGRGNGGKGTDDRMVRNQCLWGERWLIRYLARDAIGWMRLDTGQYERDAEQKQSQRGGTEDQ